MTHENRSRITIDPKGKARLYQHQPLLGWEFAGTVTAGGDTGALVRNKATGVYAQANAGAIRSLDQRKVKAALGIDTPRGRPVLPAGEVAKTRGIRLADTHYDKLKRLGMDWLRQQIEQAQEPR